MSPADPALRASDHERDLTVAQLREHYGAGRISSDELDERSDAAFGARTVAELQALLADLPALPAPPPRRGHDAGLEAAKRRVLQSAGTFALVVVACVAIWLATGADGSFWPIWVILFGGIRVAFVAWGKLGPGSGERRRLGRGSAARPGANDARRQ
jgi:uncharacterized membrane protein YccC